MTAEPDDQTLLVRAFALIADGGWSGFSRAKLAEGAGISLERVYAELPDRMAILRSLGRRLDAAMLSFPPGELEGLNVRERLFELVMRRFEAMTPFKAGLKALGQGGTSEPELILAALGNVTRAADWMLDAAGAGLSGWRAGLGRNLLLLVYGRVFNVWLEDDGPDLAKTMAELDKRLQQLERLAQWTSPRASRREPADAGPEALEPLPPQPPSSEPPSPEPPSPEPT